VLDDRAAAVAELDVCRSTINQRHLWELVSDVEVKNDRPTKPPTNRVAPMPKPEDPQLDIGVDFDGWRSASKLRRQRTI
jgi:hypothetical protein